MKWTLCVTLPKFITLSAFKNGTISNNCKTSADGGGFSAFFAKKDTGCPGLPVYCGYQH